MPFARTLAEAIPPVAVRLRRDFATVVALIRAHALLHQMRRERDAGRVVAEFNDYGAVRELVADLVADAVERTVPATVRDTVAAIGDLTLAGGETTVVAAASRLGLDKSAAWRRVRVAVDRGYVKNLEEKRGRPARLTLGDPLPEDLAVLPTRDDLERLHGCTVAPGGYVQTSSDAPFQEGTYSTPLNTAATVQPLRDSLAIAREVWGDELVESET